MGLQNGSLVVVVAKVGQAVLTHSVGSGYGPVRGVGRICFPCSENSGLMLNSGLAAFPPCSALTEGLNFQELELSASAAET